MCSSIYYQHCTSISNVWCFVAESQLSKIKPRGKARGWPLCCTRTKKTLWSASRRQTKERFATNCLTVRESQFQPNSFLIEFQLFDREWKASVAKDNGRTEEFIQRRDYPDKSRCYECGEFGHLSYKCPKNALGSREPPPKVKRYKKSEIPELFDDPGTETLGAAIRYEVYLYYS